LLLPRAFEQQGDFLRWFHDGERIAQRRGLSDVLIRDFQ
jgi:hypothetical protein